MRATEKKLDACGLKPKAIVGYGIAAEKRRVRVAKKGGGAYYGGGKEKKGVELQTHKTK